MSFLVQQAVGNINLSGNPLVRSQALINGVAGRRGLLVLVFGCADTTTVATYNGVQPLFADQVDSGSARMGAYFWDDSRLPADTSAHDISLSYGGSRNGTMYILEVSDIQQGDVTAYERNMRTELAIDPITLDFTTTVAAAITFLFYARIENRNLTLEPSGTQHHSTNTGTLHDGQRITQVVGPTPAGLTTYEWNTNGTANVKVYAIQFIEDVGAVTRTLTGATTGQATTAGALVARRLVTGAIAGQATTSGALAARRSLTGVAAGDSTTAGVLAREAVLAGTATSSATTSGALTAQRTMSGAAVGQATIAGSLTARRNLAGTTSGLATTFGALDKVASGTKNLSGVASGAATSAGVLAARRAFAGAAAGDSSTVGALARRAVFSGAAVSDSTTSGVLTRVASFSGVASGSATTSGALAARRLLAGTSDGAATVLGALFAHRLLSGSATGSATTLGGFSNPFAAVYGPISGDDLANPTVLEGVDRSIVKVVRGLDVFLPGIRVRSPIIVAATPWWEHTNVRLAAFAEDQTPGSQIVVSRAGPNGWLGDSVGDAVNDPVLDLTPPARLVMGQVKHRSVTFGDILGDVINSLLGFTIMLSVEIRVNAAFGTILFKKFDTPLFKGFGIDAVPMADGTMMLTGRFYPNEYPSSYDGFTTFFEPRRIPLGKSVIAIHMDRSKPRAERMAAWLNGKSMAVHPQNIGPEPTLTLDRPGIPIQVGGFFTDFYEPPESMHAFAIAEGVMTPDWHWEVAVDHA